MKTTFKYLGMPVGKCHKRSKLWEEAVKRLSRWKGKFIFMARKLYLIKLLLSALPMFYLSLYKISVMVLREIMRLQRKFFLGMGLGW